CQGNTCCLTQGPSPASPRPLTWALSTSGAAGASVTGWAAKAFVAGGVARASVTGGAAWALVNDGGALLSTLLAPLSGVGRDVQPGRGFHRVQNMAYLEAVCEGDQDVPVDDLTTNKSTSTYSRRV
ncbi:hypothetical protein MAR_018673, partial [Mya arenaria]